MCIRDSSKADANSEPIIVLTFQSATRSHLEVSDYAENVIAQRLQTIDGVSDIRIFGQKKYAMRIWMDPAKMAAQGVTTQDVKRAPVSYTHLDVYKRQGVPGV